MAFEVSFVPLFIDGQYRSSSTGTTFSVHNPYTKQRVYTAAAASSADCVAAIEAAQRAQPAWEALGPQVRAAMLTRVGTVFESEAWQARLKDAQLAETASPWVMQEYNAGSAAAILRNAAGMANELKGETFPSTIPGGQVVVQRRAQGVIYSVVPWNVPVPVTLRPVTIPIICGNTVVLRPSEYGPRAVAVIAGIPPGVINFVPMSTEDTPKLTSEIISHPFVRAINFTGSDRVGRLIAIEAAKHLKPCILELGGKAPAIVLADADIPTAGRGIVFGGFLNSGQGCMCTERVIVMRPALPALLAAMEDLSASLVVGDPSAPETALSSLFTDAGAENILGLIREAKDAGAEILLGDLQRDGSLVKPHIVVGVKKGMRLWERETFGPGEAAALMLAVTVADTVQEAIELAIDSEYSLVSSLWTRDVHAAMEVATQIRAG
ncbi:aldehyde dehydrogenase [Amylostereum chailletii]|nr:aldehyde dehydrogenase [Amylostereum chailletii]